MKMIRYTRWDGTQDPFDLQRREIVRRFMENVMEGLTPTMAMMQMLWEGFPLAGKDFRVMGLEEMIGELQKIKEDLFSRYSLERIFQDPMAAVAELLRREAQYRSAQGAPPPPAFDELPRGLLEKIGTLENFSFQNEESGQAFATWKDRKNDILALYDFYSRYASRFTGSEYLSFEEALDLMRRFTEVEQLQIQLLSGQFSEVDQEALRQMLGETAGKSFLILLQLPDEVTRDGIVEFDRGGFQMTPRGMRALGELAFGAIDNQMRRDRGGAHRGNAPDAGEIEPDSSRPFQFGDRFDLDIGRSIFHAVSRGALREGTVTLDADDFHVREREPLVTSTTIVLLDLSWSMARDGRFAAAKRVALALEHFIRTRFPKDKLHIVGFSTEARELKGRQLAATIWDRQRPFTNLQGGLRLAMDLIKQSGNRNNTVIVITDGQPTAYYRDDHLHVELPQDMLGVSPNACKATLAEVRRVTARGMHIESFMLDDNPALVEFMKQIAMINGGRAIVCRPGELGKMIVVEEIRKRNTRV